MVIPTILEKDFEEIKRKVALVENFARQIQIDVIDNTLVKNTTFSNITKLDQIKTPAFFEIHLLVQNPEKYVMDLKNVRAMCAQVEGENLHEFICQVHFLGYKVGISLNSETPNSEIDKYSQNIDYVQFMAIEPGKQGNEFKPEVLEKITQFKNKYPNMPCQVDGSINLQTIKQVVSAGVDKVVVGSYIFESENPLKAFKELETYFKP